MRRERADGGADRRREAERSLVARRRGFNFGDLLIGNIARIEVLRGAQSVLWGSQAIGGVVNPITRQPTEDLQVNARAEGGSFGTGQGFANISGKSGPVSANLGAGYYRTDGVSAFDGGAEKDGYRNAGANGSVSVALTDSFSVDLRGFYSDSRNDLDGFPPPDFTFGDTREWSRTEAADRLCRREPRFARRQAAQPGWLCLIRALVAAMSIQTACRRTFRSSGRNERVEYQGVLDLSDAVQGTFGAEREVTRFASSSFGGPADKGRSRLFSVYGQLVVTPIRA